MYMSHSSIPTPTDETLCLWHYMNLFKFIDLIQRQAMFFCRLRDLPDKREGTLPDGVLNRDPYVKSNAEEIAETVRDTVLVNCWHACATEDERMWREYVPSGFGVAVRTTLGKLKDSFRCEPHQQYIGLVTYADFSKDLNLNARDIAAALCVKSHTLAHEREVRVLVVSDDDGSNGGHVPLSLDVLIEEVIVSPDTPAMARSVVERLLTDCGLNIRVSNSVFRT
jgi:hypothetical protein